MKIEQETRMRDGSVAEDPRLGRLAEYDPKSRQYDISEVLESAALTTKSWANRTILNQGSTSACTGMSRTYDIAGYPKPVEQFRDSSGIITSNSFAQRLYKLAQTMDEWAGQDYEGSSVLGALKAAVSLGYVGEYRWAFDFDDMLSALVRLGPVVVGTEWFNSMFTPRPSGLIEVDPSSGVAGGHAYYFRRILVSKDAKKEFLGAGETLKNEPLLVVRNSWGQAWGKVGEAGMWASDYQNHLWPNGEQSVVTKALAKP